MRRTAIQQPKSLLPNWLLAGSTSNHDVASAELEPAKSTTKAATKAKRLMARGCD